jgi:hypothetical protein
MLEIPIKKPFGSARRILNTDMRGVMGERQSRSAEKNLKNILSVK